MELWTADCERMMNFGVDRFEVWTAECERMVDFGVDRSGIKGTFKRFDIGSASHILEVRRF